MKNLTIAFIGSGNIANSMIGGLIANGVDSKKIGASDPDETQKKLTAKKYGITVFKNNQDAAKKAVVIIFAVKPENMQIAIKKIFEIPKIENKLLLSVAAGIKIESIENWIDRPTSIVRVMPNITMVVQAGASALYANEHATNEDKKIAEYIMKSVGVTIWLDDENHMDSVTALSGSGPAYFFYLMEIMENNAVEMGLNKEDARLLTVETALGAAKMAVLSKTEPKELRQQVTSAGGTTEKAINVVVQGRLDELFRNAMDAAKERSIELSKSFED